MVMSVFDITVFYVTVFEVIYPFCNF